MPGQNLNTVTISQFTDLIERNYKVYNEFPETGVIQKLFITEDLSDHTGNSRRYAEIDPEDFASRKEEGDDAKKAMVQYGYEKDLIMQRYAREIDITWEMRRLNKRPEVVSMLTSLTHFCPNRMEIDGTHRLTFGTATSYVDMDGFTVDTTVGDTFQLIYASHTLKGNPALFSNVITGNPVFSKGGLEVAELQANTQILSHFGKRRVMKFNTVFTSDDPTTVNEVKQFLRSTTDIDQNNPSVINVYHQKYDHVILPYLATTADGTYDSTKAKYWGLVAAGQGVRGWQAYLGIWERPNLKTPAPGNNGEDMHNDNWTYGTRGSWSYATVSARGILMSTGAGV